jgi:hypothetical protein
MDGGVDGPSSSAHARTLALRVRRRDGLHEDDITYAVGWGHANSERLCRALVAAAFGDEHDHSELTGVLLQQAEPETGRAV